MYKEQSRSTKMIIKEAKNRTWEEFGTKFETNNRKNQKLFLKVLKSLIKEKQRPLQYIKNKEGKIVTVNKEIISRWKENFQELLGGNNTQNAEKQDKQKETIHRSRKKKKQGS